MITQLPVTKFYSYNYDRACSSIHEISAGQELSFSHSFLQKNTIPYLTSFTCLISGSNVAMVFIYHTFPPYNILTSVA